MSATYANTTEKVTANTPDTEMTAKYHLEGERGQRGEELTSRSSSALYRPGRPWAAIHATHDRAEHLTEAMLQSIPDQTLGMFKWLRSFYLNQQQSC